MKMIYGFLRDIGRDLIWFLIMAVLAAFTFSALYASLESTGFSKEYEEGYYALKDQKYVFANITEISAIANQKQRSYERRDVLETYFKKAMTKDGPAGMIVPMGFMQQEEYVPEGLFLVGTARDLANVPLGGSEEIRVFAPEALRKERPILSFGEEKIPVELLADDFKIYTLESYLWDNSYVLICPDFETFLEMAGEGSSLYLKYYLQDLILADPAPEDILALKKAALSGANSFLSLEGLEDKLSKESLQAGMLRVTSALWFTVAAAVGLIISILMIQKRLIHRRFHDYAVNHLFGSSFHSLFSRIFLYCLLQYVLAAAGAMWLLIRVVGMVRSPSPLPWTVLVLSLSLGMTVLCFTELKRNHLIYLRRSKE